MSRIGSRSFNSTPLESMSSFIVGVALALVALFCVPSGVMGQTSDGASADPYGPVHFGPIESDLLV